MFFFLAQKNAADTKAKVLFSATSSGLSTKLTSSPTNLTLCANLLNSVYISLPVICIIPLPLYFQPSPSSVLPSRKSLGLFSSAYPRLAMAS